MHGSRIMVIDDENIVGKVFRAVLGQEGYQGLSQASVGENFVCLD